MYHIRANIDWGNCDCTIMFLAWGPDKNPDLVLSQVLNNWVYFNFVWWGTAHSIDCGDPTECWLCWESTEPTLSILGGLAVVLNGVHVDTGVWTVVPFIGGTPLAVDDTNGRPTTGDVDTTPVPATIKYILFVTFHLSIYGKMLTCLFILLTCKSIFMRYYL